MGVEPLRAAPPARHGCLPPAAAAASAEAGLFPDMVRLGLGVQVGSVPDWSVLEPQERRLTTTIDRLRGQGTEAEALDAFEAQMKALLPAWECVRETRRLLKRRYPALGVLPAVRRLAVCRDEGHHAARGLGDIVIAGVAAAGSIGPVHAPGGKDQAGSEGAQVFIADAQPIHGPRPEVFRHDVDLLDKMLDDRDPLGTGEVEAEAAFVPVE